MNNTSMKLVAFIACLYLVPFCAKADGNQNLLSGEAALAMVLDVAQAWPSDLRDLSGLVATNSEYAWMEPPTWPSIEPSNDPDDAWRGFVSEWQGRTAHQPSNFGRKYYCIRLGRNSIAKARKEIERITNGKHQQSVTESPPETNFSTGEIHAVAFFFADVPDDAVAAQTCEVTIPVELGFDYRTNAILHEYFEEAGHPNPKLIAQLKTINFENSGMFSATGWSKNAVTTVDHIVGRTIPWEDGKADFIVVNVTSWLRDTNS